VQLGSLSRWDEPMKVMTILGTRPEIIRLSRIIPRLDEESQHVLVNTTQNYDTRLNALFFEELCIREPDETLAVRGAGPMAQIARILEETEALLARHRPDRVLLLGDTNSGMSAIAAARMGTPVYHMEAGNRCYDDRVPEEINRRIIDACSSVLLPYTHRSKENLIREGFRAENIYVTGNPIAEVIAHYHPKINASAILTTLGLTTGEFFLVTLHRQENVDVEGRLRRLVRGLVRLSREYGYPVICSVHPRTRARLSSTGIDAEADNVRMLAPFGLFDFIQLERNAFCILSDSGTVQEEACILRVPCVVTRDVTERPETLECGSSILAGIDPDTITDAVRLATRRERDWTPPVEYTTGGVAKTVCGLLLGHRDCRRAEPETR
jgi:UDP-N-acetylglucosamine 2-epimerase (non-hydrolysing)